MLRRSVASPNQAAYQTEDLSLSLETFDSFSESSSSHCQDSSYRYSTSDSIFISANTPIDKSCMRMYTEPLSMSVGARQRDCLLEVFRLRQK